MALTAYCKKCGRDVLPGDACPMCGAKLGKTALRSHWHVPHSPVRDWMCWNAVMRLALPAFALVFIAVFLSELLSGGRDAFARLLQSDLLRVLCILLVSFTGLLFFCLLLRGRDEHECFIDNSGIHKATLLPKPTRLKLLMRSISPSLYGARTGENGAPLNLGEKVLPWKNIARVQLWPEKLTIIFYQPYWWERFFIRCTPDSWDDAISLIYEKLEKKKKVILPRT